jgi:hypothetical protein
MTLALGPQATGTLIVRITLDNFVGGRYADETPWVALGMSNLTRTGRPYVGDSCRPLITH